MPTTTRSSASEPVREPKVESSFIHHLAHSAVILGEGAVIERLRRMPGILKRPSPISGANASPAASTMRLAIRSWLRAHSRDRIG